MPHLIITILAIIIIIFSLYKYYKPSIDVVTEQKRYKILLWYNLYDKNGYINRKFIHLITI